MILRWLPARGSAHRVSACGRYRVSPARADLGRLWWRAEVTADDSLPPVFLAADGKVFNPAPWSRSEPPEGSVPDAKSWCDLHFGASTTVAKTLYCIQCGWTEPNTPGDSMEGCACAFCGIGPMREVRT